MRRTRTIVQTLAAAFAAGLVAAGSAGAEVLTPNLVQNPGAELGSSLRGGVVPLIPYWERQEAISSKLSTVVEYGAPGFPTIAQGAAIGGGSHFFAGGPADGHDDNTPAFSQALLTQDLGVPADAMKRIKAGGAEATISACLGGYGNQDDRADVVLYAYTSDAATGLVGVATLKGPRAGDRQNRTGLLPRSTTARLPLTTTSLAVGLLFDRASGQGTYNDGYADNVSVRISTSGSTPPEPDCSPIAPAPGGPPAAPSGAPPAAAPSSQHSGSNTALPLTQAARRIVLTKRYALVRLRCAARDEACAGTLTLSSTAARLGSARFAIGAGKSATVKVKLRAKARRVLGRLPARRLAKLKVTATARIGAQTTSFTFAAKR
jgi:hypothetical protein